MITNWNRTITIRKNTTSFLPECGFNMTNNEQEFPGDSENCLISVGG